MANPSKAKGTSGETELKRILEHITGRSFRRTTPGCAWDLETIDGIAGLTLDPVNILATRPDHGQWLLSMTPEDWLANPHADVEIRVEVKRYARFALHAIYESKFSRLP